MRGHGIRSAALGIRIDRLPVADVDNRQQDHDGNTYGHDVLHAQQAQREQQRERSLGPIGSGTERIKTEDRDTGDRADVFGTLLAGGKRPPEEQIDRVF